ncbi:hypothetical protein SK128_025475, partial [Halocaridina rubra]
MELDDSPSIEGWITVGKNKRQWTTSNNTQNHSISTINVNNASQTTTLQPEGKTKFKIVASTPAQAFELLMELKEKLTELSCKLKPNLH